MLHACCLHDIELVLLTCLPLGLIPLALCAFIHLSGQGLIPAPDCVGADIRYKSLYSVLQDQLQQARSWRDKYEAASHSTKAASMGAGLNTGLSDTVLSLAVSPAVYSSVDPKYTGDKRVVRPPRNQAPCATCVAHVVVEAAEAAVASVTGLDVLYDLDELSVQDMYSVSLDQRVFTNTAFDTLALTPSL